MHDMNDDNIAECPVMKNKINKEQAAAKGLVREHNGKKYYFCCEGCPEKFEENPEKYLGEENHDHDKEDHHSGGGGCCG